MGYDIAYDGDDHAELATFLAALAWPRSSADRKPWCVEVTHALTDTGDPIEHTDDYALLGVMGSVVHLRPWPAEILPEAPGDVGTDLHIDVDRISGIRIY